MSRQARPRRFDRNLIVIGGGSAGLVAAYVGAALKASVTLVERSRMGGDCLNTGCVPSKTLIRTTRLLHQARRSRDFGIRRMEAEFDFGEVMDRVQNVIRAIEPRDSAARYAGLGVECLQGAARLASPWTVEVNGRTLSSRGIVLATGAEPLLPPIPGIGQVPHVTTDTVWALRTLPPRLLVLGGGAAGCELAQCFVRLGSAVTIVEQRPTLLGGEDPDVCAALTDGLERDGVVVRCNRRARRFRLEGRAGIMECDAADGSDMEFDLLLVAAGRRPRSSGYGLEELGVELEPTGAVRTDPWLRATHPSIFACGDLAGPYQFTHMAAHQAWYAAINALLGPLLKLRVDYRTVPYAVFTDPECARVGLSESDAAARGVAWELTTFPLSELDRAVTDGVPAGFVKVLTPPGSDRILGAAVVGENAGELILEFTSAMRHGLGLRQLLRTIHVYPTLSEANRHAAGAWQRNHPPQRLLRWLEWLHRWRLG